MPVVVDKYDFSGYATRNDLKCSDGRIIRKDAFKSNDGTKVPLVWQHLHNDPSNVLGHAILENRQDGVYAYCVFNETEAGENAKLLVQHGDIKSLSIFANELVQQQNNVMHGKIREVSLVMFGANPGAVIDNLSITHDGGSIEVFEDEAIIYNEDEILYHEDKKVDMGQKTQEEPNKDERTIKDVWDSMTDEQQKVCYFMIGTILETVDEEEMSQSGDNNDILKHQGDDMKRNVFEGQPIKSESVKLTSEDWNSILQDGLRLGSLRKSFLAHEDELIHAGTYGIDNISLLFPDAQTVGDVELYSRDMGWVNTVLTGTRHSPFSRIKTIYGDITADNARAKGYVTGAEKKEEVFGLLSRTTTPTTIYKKQKLDREDIIDITDLDVVAFTRSEMRLMINEELARAALVGDGRQLIDEDKISETAIRPIWTDADMYAHHITAPVDATTEDIIDLITDSKRFYKGSGSTIMFVTPAFLSTMMLLKDSLGYRIYKTEAELAATLRVGKIVEVPVMDNLSREIAGPVVVNLMAIIVDLRDYTFGADRGGELTMFDDFDIDFNQYKYLLETRCSGALTKLKSAIVIEKIAGD